MNVQDLLEKKLTQAMQNCGLNAPALVKPAVRKEFGDYQANGVMAAAKASKKTPVLLARAVVEEVGKAEFIEKIEVAGPGFLNIFINTPWLSREIERLIKDPCCGIDKVKDKRVIAVDYSHPNVAKEMHVGHLRSTIIGDAMVRVLDFFGHRVIRCNHIGDWGTQFGMLIAYLELILQADPTRNDPKLADLENFYRTAKKHYDEDPAFAEVARSYVVKLQQGDECCLALWQRLVDLTMAHNQKNYERLNVLLTPADIMGESMYNPFLPEIVAHLKKCGLAQVNAGAQVVYLQEFKNKEDQPLGVIVQKSDGGYLYTTTDLACLKYRYEKLKAGRILYYVDARQSQHLKQVFCIARKAGFIPQDLAVEHHAFGMMLGRDKKPFKTRSGGVIRLADLLDEAQKRAALLVAKKNPHMPAEKVKEIADVLGIAAVKYADLSKNRLTDYIFDWNNMLSFEGNTAPYLLYAYTRILSIFRKINKQPEDIVGQLFIEHSLERDLCIKLLRFSETLKEVAHQGYPHLLCLYLYELAGLFMSFYENCPIHQAATEHVRNSRLFLCLGVGKVLKQGLHLLGIQTLERM